MTSPSGITSEASNPAPGKENDLVLPPITCESLWEPYKLLPCRVILGHRFMQTNFYRILFLFIISSCLNAYGQNTEAVVVTNIRYHQEGKTVVVNYDLTGGEQGQKYTVKLFVSEDGGSTFKGPLLALTGAVGSGISAGYSKQIIWDVLSEPGRDRLQGDRIRFKVKAEYFETPKTTTSGYGKPCPGMRTFTDPRDEQVYPTVQIGSQCWMQKNMNYKTGNSWCYGKNSDNCSTYGRLYDWETALKACPEGWHLPSDDEWATLTTFLGGLSVAGGKMKETGTKHWFSPNTGASNSSGFSAVPSGYRDYLGHFCNLTGSLYFWSSSEISSSHVWSRKLIYNSEYISRSNDGKTNGFSCRCLRD